MNFQVVLVSCALSYNLFIIFIKNYSIILTYYTLIYQSNVTERVYSSKSMLRRALGLCGCLH